jgi:hypothetical protein
MRQLSERMHDLTQKATQDAAAVKVLTILTLIYLPATVVSNFFSASFVSTNGNQNIVVLSDWWIFVASSVPLDVTGSIYLVGMDANSGVSDLPVVVDQKKGGRT